MFGKLTITYERTIKCDIFPLEWHFICMVVNES